MQVRYAVIDNRGKKRDMLPHEAFSAVQTVDGLDVLSVHCYSREHAENIVKEW